MADIYIKFDELRTAKGDLDDIIEEFENASSNATTLEHAIGNPFGKDKLREKAEDFEDRWNDKREDLTESLKKVRDHVKGVIDGVTDWDAQTAAKLDTPDVSTTAIPASQGGHGRTAV